ncbi:MAG: hypothetical protein CL527_00655 [Aequorivita sp.]|nr:hypothetical protein [Aequorivita sp.]
MSTDLGTYYDVSTIDPPIAPSLSISEDLSFNGMGACNTFSGNYEFIGELFSISFNATTEDCGIQLHNNFESEYFGFIQGGYTYTIEEDNDGRVLSFETPLFGFATFKSYPLSTTDFQRNAFQLYPNPTKDILFLNPTNPTENLKVKIFNLEGRLLRNLNLENQTSMDVSNLESGIYFLNIEVENGNKAVKKFIKQ